MSEHTPGFWRLRMATKRWIVEAAESESCRCGGVCVAEVYPLAEVCNDRHADANARLIAASPDLLALAKRIGAAYPNDPGTSDLYDEQAVTITLGDVRRAWAVLAKVDR